MTTEVKRGQATGVELDGKQVAADEVGPVAASASGTASGQIVSVGWGLVDAEAKLDEYKGKSVKGKIALVHRFTPPDAKLEPSATIARSATSDIKRSRPRPRAPSPCSSSMTAI